MTRPHELLWERTLRRVAERVPAHEMESWIRPLAADWKDPDLHIACPSAFHRDRVRERYLETIRRAAAAETDAPVCVKLALGAVPARSAPARVPPREGSPTRAVVPAADAPIPNAATPNAVPQVAPAPEAPPRRMQRAHQPGFDDFLVGPPNALAREASLALVEARQREVNPLYLAGEPGLGKSHLARAVAHEARARRARVLYTSAEGFTSEFLGSLRGARIGSFKRRFREECDILVLEDVEFLRGKESTQLELFHTVSHLLDAGGRVLFTGDRLPREIPDLDRRLRAQMTSGMVAELGPPDAELRRRLLRARAAAGGVRLPAACLERMVEGVQGSVRDLESVLGQIVASAALLKRPIDLALTEAALRKLGPGEGAPIGVRRVSVREVIEMVAAFFGTTPAAMTSRSRRRDVLLPRQLAMYLCRRYTDASLSEIGRTLGRDHPAVRNAVSAMERQILERAPLRYQVEALSDRLEHLRSG